MDQESHVVRPSQLQHALLHLAGSECKDAHPAQRYSHMLPRAGAEDKEQQQQQPQGQNTSMEDDLPKLTTWWANGMMSAR
eukprot:1150039-Pelagomonas_calceolata.AAC.1